MREDGDRLSGWKSLSSDGGRSWSVPVRCEMPRCLGRPSAGRLRSGEIAITYRNVRCGLSTSLGLYVETPEEALKGLVPSGDESKNGPTEARFAVLELTVSPSLNLPMVRGQLEGPQKGPRLRIL